LPPALSTNGLSCLEDDYFLAAFFLVVFFAAFFFVAMVSLSYARYKFEHRPGYGAQDLVASPDRAPI
jgi:hypothetical protein